MIKRLRIKFICVNMALVTVMLLVIFGLVLHFTRENLERQSIGMLQSIMDERGFPGKPGARDEDVRLPWFRVSQDPEGKQMVQYNGFADQFDPETLEEILRQAQASGQRRGFLKNYQLRFGKLPGPLEQIVFVDISSEIATMRNLVRTCLIIGALSFLILLVLSLMLSRWATRPVEEAWEQQRQFVADASHELKTPLTVIMTNAELLQSPEYTQQERYRFGESILTMSRQMRFLVDSLLELARVDSGSVKTAFSQVDLSELVSEALLPFEPLYFEQQHPLECEVEPGIRVRGSRAHLNQVLDILLDNAAKYALPEGMVSVRLCRYGTHALLSVANPGAPLSREERKNIFKRFYRIDRARSRDGSYGLGLAIADGIVREHGGRIWAESEGGINTFFVLLSVI